MLTPSSGLRRLALLCLAIAGACCFILTVSSAPARADDTDGGSGQGSGAGGDGCIKSGWRLVNDADDIVWQDNGTGRECANTAYANRAAWTHKEFTDETGANHVCDTRGGASQTNCNGSWQYANTPLYTALGNMGANACYRRTDLHGIWYLQDAGLDGIRSWTNLGDASDGDHRTVNALKDAIDNTWDPARTELVDSGSNGSDAWWDSRIKDYLGQGEYDAEVKFYVRAYGQTQAQAVSSVRSDAKAKLMATIKDVTGGNNPVIFCWYSDITHSGLSCADRMPAGMGWDDYLHPAGVTRGSMGVVDCIRRCPTAQGQYPYALPRAGEWIPSATGTQNPHPANNSDDAIADYCYPPTSISWHQGAYGSAIPGIGYTVEGQQGSNTDAAAQPYAYVSAVEDGNGAYNATTKTGNAPGQGQLTSTNAAKKTAFGAFVDSYCAGSPSCSSGQVGDPGSASYIRFVSAYNAAVAAQPTETHATLDLTDEQKAQVGKGRILNIIEYTTYTSAQARKLLDRFYDRVATRTIYYNLSGVQRSNTTAYTPWTYDPAAHLPWNAEAVPADMAGVYRPDFAQSHPDIQKWDHDEAVYGSTPKATGFWQNAVTHCNNQEFSTLNPSGTATGTNDAGVLDTGDASQYYSASAVYKIQDSNYAVNAPAVDFTKARWGATTSNASAKPAFFDRLCYYPGTAKNPVTMTDQNAGTQGSFKFARDGERHTLEGTKGTGDSPYFVPSFKGEDRDSTISKVDGYQAEKRTQITPDTWKLSWEERYISGYTPVNPATAPYYYGNYSDAWTCNIGAKKTSCNGGPINETCTHSQPLYNGSFGPQSTPGQSVYLYLGCAYRTVNSYYYPGTPQTGGDPIYAWRANSATYTSQADSDGGYGYCIGQQNAGNWRSCNVAKSDATWSSWAVAAVPSCPQVDTTTTQYRNCVPVAHNETVTTNYNVVDYKGEDPTQVIVTRDPSSTPIPSLATLYGLTNTGLTTRLFTEADGDLRTPKTDGVYQSQFADNPMFSSNTVAVASGAYKRLQAKGVWASDRALPQVLSMAWYFTPSVRSTFAQTNVGFGRAGGQMTYREGEYSTPVRGRVEAMANAVTTDDGMSLADHQNQTWASTGTNIEDNLNVPLAYGQDRGSAAPYGWLSDPSKLNGHYYTVTFVRAVGE